MQFFFKDFEEYPEEFIFCKATEIFRMNIKTREYHLIHEFFQGFCNHAMVTLHIDNLKGENGHHIAETIFKAFGRAFKYAKQRDFSNNGNKPPSTKGVL